MGKIQHKRYRYWQYQYELFQEKDITHRQGVVYSYIYNHCVNLNEGGWCGYSDARMAKELKMELKTFRRELKVLKDKKLIIVKNPQKRSKKNGESRMLYINDENYLTDDQLDQREIENENLKREIEKLKKQIEFLSSQEKKDEKPNLWGVYLIKSGFITSHQYMEDVDFYNSLLNSFANATDMVWTKKAIEYISKSADKDIRNHAVYLESALSNSIYKYRLKNGEINLDFGEDGLTF